MGLKYCKRRKAPKYKPDQLEKLPGKCRKLRRDLTDSNTVIIVDDEKYFSFSGENMPSNAGFYTADVQGAPTDVKFKSKEKFAPKILVWLAVSSKGISTPYVRTTKGPAINYNTYTELCLPELLTFIQEHHQGENYVFWSDLASSHYAKRTIDWLHDRNVPFIPKSANPPNVPKARPIEDFWSILADKVYEGGWEAKNEKQLANRIKRQLKKIDFKVVQTMMFHVRRKLRKIEDGGPFSIL